MMQLFDCSGGRCFFYIILIISIINSPAVYAQEEGLREYTPDEFISLNRDLTIDAALEIINQFSSKYENKMIIDPKERKGKIGVVVDNMHWKRALEYILRSNLLKYIEHPRHYEVVDMIDKKKSQEPLESEKHSTDSQLE